MFNKIRKAFGFSGADDDELIHDDPDFGTQKDPGSVNLTEEVESLSTDIHIATENNSEITRKIFEHVIAEFNKALPDFIKNSVEPERQEQYLYNTLSEDIKEHIRNMEDRAMVRMEKKWQEETVKLQSELKQLKQTAKDLDAKRSNIKEQQLSSERQRRALTERVRDLENQILTLEAQKEQYELETKSLINKVKVAQVYEKDIAEMREQINSLQSELIKERNRIPSDESESVKVQAIPQETLDELARLKDIEIEHNTLLETLGELERHMDNVKSEITGKDEEIDRLKKALDEVTASDKKSENEEIKRLNNRLSSVQAELEIALKSVESAEARAQKAESALKEFKESKPTQIHQRPTQSFDDDILSGTDWAISAPARRQRKNPTVKKERNDDGELSLW